MHFGLICVQAAGVPNSINLWASVFAGVSCVTVAGLTQSYGVFIDNFRTAFSWSDQQLLTAGVAIFIGAKSSILIGKTL